MNKDKQYRSMRQRVLNDIHAEEDARAMKEIREAIFDSYVAGQNVDHEEEDRIMRTIANNKIEQESPLLPNPHEGDDGWYWYDEAGEKFGPYINEEEADKILSIYDSKIKNDQEISMYREWVNDLQSGMYINCVYCGHRYGPREEVSESMSEVLKEHIEKCPKHPMSKLKELYNDLLSNFREEVENSAKHIHCDRCQEENERLKSLLVQNFICPDCGCSIRKSTCGESGKCLNCNRI